VQWSPPSLATVSPAAAPTRGGTVITLSGANFGTGSRTEVMVGAQACPLVTVGHATLTCVVPAAVTPGSSPVVVTVGLQATAPGAFSYAAPSISGVSPLRVPTAGGTTLTVIGASFGSASAGVTLAGQACPVLQQGHGAVLCRAPAGQGANLPLVVVSGGQASPAYFVSYEAPLVASTWPPRLPTTQTTLWIRGRDFGTSPAVTLGGVACPVLRSTGTEVVCAAPPGSPAAVPLVVVAAGQVSQTVLVTRTATCGRELSNGAVCEDHRECRGVGTCLGADCVGAPAASEGLACEDEDPCSSPGTCRSGVCLSPTGLDGGEACVTGSVCSGLGACLAGRCNAVPLNEDAGCTDYDGTTAGDVCRLGRCVGTPSAGDGGLPDGGGSADGGSGGGAAGGAAGGIAGGIAGGAAGGIAGGAAGGIAGGTAGGVAGGTAGGVAGGTAGGIAGGAAGGVAGGTAGGVAGGAAGGVAGGTAGGIAGGAAGGVAGGAAGGVAGGTAGGIAGGAAGGVAGGAAGGVAGGTAGGVAGGTAGGIAGGAAGGEAGGAGGGAMGGSGCGCAATSSAVPAWLFSLSSMLRRRRRLSSPPEVR
jgi:hypothetical protein